MIPAVLHTEMSPEPAPSSADTGTRGSFWSRHKTLINFWLDVVLLALFLVQAWMLTVIVVVFPRGEDQWKIWGNTASEWLDGLFSTFCVFAVAIVLHVMFHWTWICGTVATKLLGKKAGKDDGSQTLIGVGFLVVLLHMYGAAVLAARVSLMNPWK